MEVPGSLNRWDRYHIIPQLAVYTTYIPLIYCLLGDYIYHLPPIKGTRNRYWPIGVHTAASFASTFHRNGPTGKQKFPRCKPCDWIEHLTGVPVKEVVPRLLQHSNRKSRKLVFLLYVSQLFRTDLLQVVLVCFFFRLGGCQKPATACSPSNHFLPSSHLHYVAAPMPVAAGKVSVAQRQLQRKKNLKKVRVRRSHRGQLPGKFPDDTRTDTPVKSALLLFGHLMGRGMARY